MKQLAINTSVARKKFWYLDQWQYHTTKTPISMTSFSTVYTEATVKTPSFTPRFLQSVSDREIVKRYNGQNTTAYKRQLEIYSIAHLKWIKDMISWKADLRRYKRGYIPKSNQSAVSEFARYKPRPEKPKKPIRVPRAEVHDIKRPQVWTPLPYTHTHIISSAGWNGWLRKYRTSGAPPYPTFKTYESVGPGQDAGIFSVGNMASPRSLADCIAEAKNIAKLKLLARLKDSKFNGVQAYAEAGQLQKLIGTNANLIANVLITLRRGNLKAAAEMLGLQVSKRAHTRYSKSLRKGSHPEHISNVLANGILQVQYGIRPLLSDIVGAAELLAQKKSLEVVNTVRVRHNFCYEFERSNKQNLGLSTSRSIGRASRNIAVEYGVNYGKGSEVVHTLAQLGVTNPLLIAWELMPWSFVIDWFVPIGNYISSLDATFGLDFRNGYVSTKSMTIDHYETQVSPGTYAGYDIGYAVNHSESEQFTREILGSFPTASLPHFKNPFSWEHALNGIALLVGLKNRLVKSTFN